MQVIPEAALQRSGRRVPFPISAVCKGDNEAPLPPPQDANERRVLGKNCAAAVLPALGGIKWHWRQLN